MPLWPVFLFTRGEHMLSEYHQKLLKSAVRPKKNGEWQATENHDLAVIIQMIKEDAPECFHNSRSLADRVFYDQPSPHSPHIICKDYIRPYTRPIKITKV